MYDLILFDLDGTLLDSDRMIIETFRELYPLYRPGFYPSDEHILSFSGPQIHETLKKEFPAKDQDFKRQEFKRLSQKNYDRNCKLLRTMRRSNCRTRRRFLRRPFAIQRRKRCTRRCSIKNPYNLCRWTRN